MPITEEMAPCLRDGGLRESFSEQGRARLLSQRGGPLFLAGWERALFIHFEVDGATLQSSVPFPLDLYDGRAYASLVAFTMRGMRPRLGGRITAWPFRPFAEQRFLNVRTYVRHGEERGIYFITEWLSSWLNVQLGPLLYGLPYHHAEIQYHHKYEGGILSGTVKGKRYHGRFDYSAPFLPEARFTPCRVGSLDEFFLERYTAYTVRGPTRHFFRVWHPPWPQVPVEVSISEDSLLAGTFPWFRGAKYIGANYSPGFGEVWMGRAHRVR